MKAGDKVLYAAHEVSWQADGTPLPAEDEQWLAAEVLAVVDHPAHPGEQVDTVARLQPDDGQPPFDLNAKLVRST